MQRRDRNDRKWVGIWLWSGAAFVFLMVIIGGITRLTGSGLSMSDWNLIMGTLPPLSESEWTASFQQYKQFPEYQQVNMGITLGEFKQIFFWEYLHRLIGRLIGIVFLIPALYFWLRGYFNRKLFRRVPLLFGLGALQGLMGWVMVKSGLVDVPYVSHYRLAAHFLLAVLLITFCVWFALDLQKQYPEREHTPLASKELKRWVRLIAILFFVQILWGAFTAGLDAGYIYNSFPLMNRQWLPQNAWTMQPVIVNLVENPGTVQWIHRIVGSILGLAVVGLWVKTRFSDVEPPLKVKADVLLGLIVAQYTLGVFTLLFKVPVALGVIHQSVAVIFWVAWLIYYHELRKSYI